MSARGRLTVRNARAGYRADTNFRTFFGTAAAACLYDPGVRSRGAASPRRRMKNGENGRRTEPREEGDAKRVKTRVESRGRERGQRLLSGVLASNGRPRTYVSSPARATKIDACCGQRRGYSVRSRGRARRSANGGRERKREATKCWPKARGMLVAVRLVPNSLPAGPRPRSLRPGCRSRSLAGPPYRRVLTLNTGRVCRAAVCCGRRVNRGTHTRVRRSLSPSLAGPSLSARRNTHTRMREDIVTGEH